METLSKEQRDILLDFYFGCASDRYLVRAGDLLSNQSGAVIFSEKLKGSGRKKAAAGRGEIAGKEENRGDVLQSERSVKV